MLRNPDNALFGIGEDGRTPIWVRIVVGPKPDPKITDWRGEYFDNRALDGEPILVRNDEKIDFDWKRESPAKGVPKNNFSARWTRRIRFDAATYRFHITIDDGARLWVDDRMVIDEWELGAARELTIDLFLINGYHDLKIEYFEKGDNARAEFWWEEIN